MLNHLKKCTKTSNNYELTKVLFVYNYLTQIIFFIDEIFCFYFMILLIQTPLRNCKSFTYTLLLYSYILCEFTLKMKQEIVLYFPASKLPWYKHIFMLLSM